MVNVGQKFTQKSAIVGMVILMIASFNVASNELVLTDAQYQSLGLQVVQAKQVAQFPTQNFPAQAMFHPNTVRTLSAPLSGKVSRLNVVHGSVIKGQVIAEIESANLLELQSKLLSMSSDRIVLQSELERIKKLHRSGAASAKKMLQAQSDVDKLSIEKIQQERKLQLIGFSKKAIKELLSSQKVQSSVLQLISPIDAQIFDLSIRLGERVTQNQALFSLGETNPMLLKVKIPVTLANRLKKGNQAKILTIGLGVIEHVDPDVDAVTQTVDVHVSVDNSRQKIRPGQRFQIHFLMLQDAGQAQAVYQVPLNAITQFKGRTVVFIKQDNVIKAINITVKNINKNQLYFSLKQAVANVPGSFEVFVKGSTAIKSAFDAVQESDV